MLIAQPTFGASSFIDATAPAENAIDVTPNSNPGTQSADQIRIRIDNPPQGLSIVLPMPETNEEIPAFQIESKLGFSAPRVAL